MNTGFLKYDMDIEVEAGVFNTSGSKLWEKVRRVFDTQLKEEYAKMRLDRFTVDNIMKYVAGEQVLQIPERNYNIDMQRKYLDYGPAYLYACHGNRYQHMKRWIRERLVYVDTLMGYYGSTSEYVTVRANKLGKVFIDLQTYIPMYLRVKFRDEANDAGTIIKKVKRNEVVRFEYNIPTETDQEIIIYASRYLKSMGDLTNLSPTTMLIANATKLTELKCTNAKKLISTDVSECVLLQDIDLSGCSLLGTGTQNTLTVNKCRYLKKLNLYGTSLTAVYTSLQGGNLEEIYYPTTIQSVNLVKQPRLKILGIPFKQDEECRSLANFEIIDCPNVERLTIDPVPEGFNSFLALKHVQSLSIKNSLKLKKMIFDGFNKLMNVKLENLYDLETCGFDNLNNVGDLGTLENVIISNCPKVTELSLNVTGGNKAINFSANNSIIDLTNATSITDITSNTSVKGLKTIILPRSVKNILFTNEYGDGISEIRNLWSYDSYVDHKTDGYLGIDFSKLNIENLDLTTCVYIDKAINFSARPKTTMIFNKYREEHELPIIKVNGTLDLSDYKGSYASMFKYMDLTNLELQCSRDTLTQTDFSYTFYGTKILENKANILMLTQKMTNAAILNFLFAESDLDRPINIVATGTYSASFMYENCINFTNLDNITVNERCISAEGMFKKCVNVVTARNIVINASGNISELFKDCTALVEISISNPLAKGKVTNMYSTFNGCSELVTVDVTKFDVSNVNTMYGTFDGCTKLKIIDLSTWEMGNVQNTSTMFQACPSLLEVDFTDKDLRRVNTASYMFHFCTSLKRVIFTKAKFEDLTNIYSMFRMATSLTDLIDFKILANVSNWSECFTQCPLENTKGLEIYANVLGGTSGIFYANEYIRKISDIKLGANVTDLNKAFMNCRSLVSDIDLPNTTRNATDTFRGCTRMVDIHANWSKEYINGIQSTNCYYGCDNIERIDGQVSTIDNVPTAWGGGGILSILSAADIYLLPDLTGKEPGLLTMTPELKASLTESQIAMIINKNWTIV